MDPDEAVEKMKTASEKPEKKEKKSRKKAEE